MSDVLHAKNTDIPSSWRVRRMQDMKLKTYMRIKKTALWPGETKQRGAAVVQAKAWLGNAFCVRVTMDCQCCSVRFWSTPPDTECMWYLFGDYGISYRMKHLASWSIAWPVGLDCGVPIWDSQKKQKFTLVLWQMIWTRSHITMSASLTILTEIQERGVFKVTLLKEREFHAVFDIYKSSVKRSPSY